jgi:hypothetical protein
LRGLYVGFIAASPSHVYATFGDELGKIAVPDESGQRDPR